MPLHAGGESVVGNLRWLCEDANRAKGRMSDERFVALCRAVVAHAGDRSRND